MPEFIAKLLADDRGATLIENAVLWGLVVWVVAGVFDSNHAAANLNQLAVTFNLR
jgi:Flp pilus assembly pilin Flp